MGNRSGILILVCGISVLVLTLLLAGTGWTSLDFATDITGVVTLLGSLTVVAAFLERALSVVNTIVFSSKDTDTQIDNSVRLLEYDIVKSFSPNDALTGEFKTAFNQNWATLNGFVAKRRAEEKSRERLRLALGFLIAILIAGVGVRSLGELVTPPLLEPIPTENSLPQAGAPTSVFEPVVAPEIDASGPETPDESSGQANLESRTSLRETGDEGVEERRTVRNWLFDLLDIILTAGLLAGGSNGIGLLIGAIKSPRQEERVDALLGQIASGRAYRTSPLV